MKCETKTRSSAVAEKPRDASCLSVVSFNSTIPRAQSFIISYFGFRVTTTKCCSVLFGVPVETCCHKQDALMPGASSFCLCDKRTPPLSVTNYSTVEIVDDTRYFISHRSQRQILVGGGGRRNMAWRSTWNRKLSCRRETAGASCHWIFC